MTDPAALGLSGEQAAERQKQYGKNELVQQKKPRFFITVLRILAEPMFLLLLVAATIYFLLGSPRDGAIMLVFVVGIIAIDVLQEWKTDRTLAALAELAAPQVAVFRDGRERQIAAADLVPGDVMLVREGTRLPADGEILSCNDLLVDESTLTGEAEGQRKVPAGNGAPARGPWRADYCYAGTLVLMGSAVVCVDKIGKSTEYGRIGAAVAEAKPPETPLARQTRALVRACALIAAALFLFVGAVTWNNIPDHAPAERLIESVLAGVTLAMAMIPEEFPVILTVFLSLGAWRLAKKHSLVRNLPSVETLGAVSVLCVDKTGTITENHMAVAALWATGDEADLVEIMGLACELDVYDPMERAMLDCCERYGVAREHLLSGRLITEYSFTNELKMMGHVWHHGEGVHIAAKGSPERILSICKLSAAERIAAEAKAREFAGRGLRVIAVGLQKPASEREIPASIADCELELLGLVGLADPPRPTVARDIAVCQSAGVRVVMITGDSGETAAAIARQIGMADPENVVTGAELDELTDEQLRLRVKSAAVFSRVVPAHKTRIVRALQQNGGIVAMTGDGVNDAPALKNADIGVAMGRRGSQVAREAADLVLLDDNFSTIVDTIRDGRRIYANIKRAVGYVLAIHVPVAAASLLGPLLGIAPNALFLLPLHVVLLELLIDPTCSVVLERYEAEPDIMERGPRDPAEKLLTARMLAKSLAQGAAMLVFSFGAYLALLKNGAAAGQARAMGLVTLLFANLLLLYTNASERDGVWAAVRHLPKNPALLAVTGGTLLLVAAALYTPLGGFLQLAPLPLPQLAAALGLAAVSTLWYEVVKAVRRRRGRR